MPNKMALRQTDRDKPIDKVVTCALEFNLGIIIIVIIPVVR